MNKEWLILDLWIRSGIEGTFDEFKKQFRDMTFEVRIYPESSYYYSYRAHSFPISKLSTQSDIRFQFNKGIEVFLSKNELKLISFPFEILQEWKTYYKQLKK